MGRIKDKLVADKLDAIELIKSAMEDASDELLLKLENLGCSFSVDSTCINCDLIGDFNTLKKVWACLRSHGLVPDKRIESIKISSFTTFWRYPPKGIFKEKAILYFNFSSTVCTMKIVGTKKVTIEKPVYELTCE